MRMEECILGERVVEGDTLRKTGIKIEKFITNRTNGSCIFFLNELLPLLERRILQTRTTVSHERSILQSRTIASPERSILQSRTIDYLPLP